MEYRTGNLVDINGGIVVLSKPKHDAALFTSYSEKPQQKRKEEIEEVSKFESKFFSYCIGGGGHQKIGETNIHYSFTTHMEDLGRSCIVYNSLTNDFIAIFCETLNMVQLNNFIKKVNRQYEEKLEQMGGYLRFPYTTRRTSMGAMHDYSYLTIVPLFIGFCLCELVIK